ARPPCGVVVFTRVHTVDVAFPVHVRDPPGVYTPDIEGGRNHESDESAEPVEARHRWSAPHRRHRAVDRHDDRVPHASRDGGVGEGGQAAGEGALIGGLAGAVLGGGYGAYKTKTECGTVFGDGAGLPVFAAR